jgi:hypothetical protein
MCVYVRARVCVCDKSKYKFQEKIESWIKTIYELSSWRQKKAYLSKYITTQRFKSLQQKAINCAVLASQLAVLTYWYF